MNVEQLIEEGKKEINKQNYNSTGIAIAYGLFAISYAITVLSDTIKEKK